MHTIERWMMLCCLVSLVPILESRAEERAPWSLEAVLERVPPLKHDATGRLPLITWPHFRSGDRDGIRTPFSEAEYRELLKRGLAQRLPFDTNSLPAALVMQRAGAPVVFLEGECGYGPYGEGPDPLHRLPEGFQIVKGTGYAGRDHLPCPGLFEGWRIRAERLRQILTACRAAGVKVDAVSLDWEGEPHVSHEHWRQAKACSRCQATLPARALDSMDNYCRYIIGLRNDLFSAYVGAPIRESYPRCAILNWEFFCSSKPCGDWEELCTSTQRPAKAGYVGDEVWGHYHYAFRHLGLLTAANPVVYGHTIYGIKCWKRWRMRWPSTTRCWPSANSWTRAWS